MDWSLYSGGHLRTGLEDNIRLTRDTLAASNAQLVERAAMLCASYGAHPATPAEARALLDLPPAEDLPAPTPHATQRRQNPKRGDSRP